ncbi:Toll-like receptor Tollo [Gryllus bimaculatus]|nr:Toll-like receptor Tollo [Gryllus bimaculatus]
MIYLHDEGPRTSHSERRQCGWRLAARLAAAPLSTRLVGAWLPPGGQGSCGSGSFRCGNSSQCVPHHFVCNRHNDCANGEDENLRMCGDAHGWNETDKMFRRAGRGPDWSKCDLEGFPLGCHCRNTTQLICKGLGLRKPPILHGDRLPERLILPDNNIQHLGPISLAHYNLTGLVLSGNGLHSIHKHALREQRRLKTLDLSNNTLEKLPRHLLQGLVHLKWLIVEHNQLQQLPLRALNGLRHLKLLDLSHNGLTLTGEHFPELPQLTILDLERNAITTLERELFNKLPRLSQLYLQHNRISTINYGAFVGNRALLRLNLSFNYLHSMDSDTMKPLGGLKALSLKANPFDYIPRSLLQPLANLSSLNLEGIEMEQLDLQIFDADILPSLQILWLHRFHFCSYAPWVKSCRPNTDGISSAEHLLQRPEQRAAVWVLAALALGGNALVLGGRAAARDDSPALSAVVRNLAAADLLMGAYLCAVGACDRELRGRYAAHALRWMASWRCTAAGAAAMLSSEVSVLVLLFLSLERFLLIAVPFGAPGGLSPRVARRVLAAIWALGLLLAALPAIQWRHSNRFYGTNGLCFPLHIEDPYMQGWQYSSFIVLGVNIPGVWRTRRRAGAAVAASAERGSRELEIALRVLLLVLTDAACWVPVAALKLLALARGHVPADVYAWVVVLVLPVNSALNPLLYTFSTPRYRTRIVHLWRRARALCRGGGVAGLEGGDARRCGAGASRRGRSR